MSTGAPSDSDPTIREVEDETLIAGGPGAELPPARTGRYEIVRAIASGGMGSVHLARDPELGRLVAIKVPRLDAANREEAMQRFLREARAAGAIRHPNVCPIHDVGVSDGQPYVVMAFIEGESLAALLARRGRLDEDAARDLGIQLAEGLGAVHDAGFLHRDLKPQNVLLDAAGRAFLADFGLARPEVDGESVTVDGSLLGTPAYMSPEQARGRREEIGVASDVYGLGAILYHLLAGRPPYQGSATEIVAKLFTERPPSLASIRPDVSRPFVRLVERMMSSDRAARPRSAAEVARALRDPGAASPRGRRLAAVLLGALAVLVAAGLAARAIGRPDEPPAPAAPAARVDLDGKWVGAWRTTRGESGEDVLHLARDGEDRFTGVWWDGTPIAGEIDGSRLVFTGRIKGRFFTVEGRFSPDGETLSLAYRVIVPDGDPPEYEGVSTLRRAPAGTGRVRTERPSYVLGERVRLRFEGPPAGTDAWIGLYPAGQESHFKPPVWDWATGGELDLPAHLAPGDYEARLFAGSGYDLLDRWAFRVESESVTGIASAPADLTVLTFNLWYGGTRVDGGLAKIAQVVREVEPDVAAFQECDESTLRRLHALLAREERWADSRIAPEAGILSRHPIGERHVADGLAGWAACVDLPGGRRLRVVNSHLSAEDYGPYLLRDGVAVEGVLAREAARRGAEVERILERLAGSEATILLGDHNSPSHLDGTVPWPVSTRLAEAGFADAFRQVHRDPAARRGFTWTCGEPKGTFQADEVHDRIDFIYHRAGGGLVLVPVEAGTIDRDPWPSDHRAVFARFEIRAE